MTFQVEYLNFMASTEARKVVDDFASILAEQPLVPGSCRLRLLQTKSGGLVAGLELETKGRRTDFVASAPTMGAVISTISTKAFAHGRPIRLVS